MKRNEGSITIFSALAIVCVICFLATIVEVTRYRMIQSESLSHVETAATLALSEYDPVLWNEYGLMYIRPHEGVEVIVEDGLSHMFFPSWYVDHATDQFSVIMEPKNVNDEVSYNPWLNPDVAQDTRTQILRYMTPRIPYIVTIPYNDMLNIYDTVKKTSLFIEEKEEILHELSYIEDIKKRLMCQIDGVVIEGNKTTYNYKSYIRAFSVENLIEDYMPEDMCKDRQKYVLYKREYIEGLWQVFQEGRQEARYLYALARQYESKKNSYKHEEDKVKKKRIREKMKDIQEDIDNSLEDIESLNTSGFVRLQLATQRIISIENALEQVVEDLNTLEQSAKVSLEELESYRQRLEQGEIMPSVKGSLMHDLDSYEKQINVLSETFDRVDNMALLKEQAESNLAIIREVLPRLVQVRDSLNGFMYHEYVEAMKGADGPYVDKIAGKLRRVAGENNHTEKEGAYKPYGYIVSLIATVDKGLSSYSSDLLLDYRYMSLSSRDEEYEEIVRQKETADRGSFLSGLKEALSDVFREGVAMQAKDLPSLIEKDTASVSSNSLEDLYVNLYYTKMLSNVSARYNDDLMSLSGYDINRYDMDAQVEYILFGHREESENIKEMSQKLFALRLLCNSVHIVADTQKRTLITELATAVAGWWTGGIGTGLVSVIIGAAWASMESMVDVGMLMYGEKVPFIKTASTWYTSLEGNWQDALVAAVGASRVEAQRISDRVHRYITDDLGIDTEDIRIIEEAYKENNYEIEFKTEEVKQLWESSIESILRGENVEFPKSIKIMDGAGQLEKVLQSYKDDYNKRRKDQHSIGLEEQVLMKENWMKNSQDTLDLTVQRWSKKKESEFESSLENLVENLKEGEGGNPINTWKKKRMQNKKAEENGNDLSWMSLSYDDYLLFFLMVSGESESVKVLRFMDVIQRNLRQSHQNPDLLLSDYGKGVKVKTSIDIDTLWMPVGFDRMEMEYEANY